MTTNNTHDINKKIREHIIQAAKSYATLTGKIYLYVYGEEYFEVLFAVGSFKHLTGVNSTVSAEDFYNKAVNRKLAANQIVFTPQKTVKKAKKKLPCLIRLPELTNSTVCIIKDLNTNTLMYKLGLTNLEFTLGMSQPSFANKLPPGVFIPRTLRVKDKAIENSNSGDFVDFIFEKSTKKLDSKYASLIYRGKKDIPPKSIHHLIDDKFYTQKPKSDD